MNTSPVSHNDVTNFVKENIGSFHAKRLERLRKLKLDVVLKRKNPYLFKAKNILTAQDLVQVLLDAHLSSQEETIFGEFLEGLAIFVCGRAFGGKKSAAEGIDLEFDRDGVRYIVSVKSGPNWGNSSQIKRMRNNFLKAARVLRTNNQGIHVVAINGCCYGRHTKPDKGDYFKYCGQEFWEFISGSSELYTEIVEPLGHEAKRRNDEFLNAYSRLLNLFTVDFADQFCDDGIINWKRLVRFNSSKKTES